jgi:hypothetical protein
MAGLTNVTGIPITVSLSIWAGGVAIVGADLLMQTGTSQPLGIDPVSVVLTGSELVELHIVTDNAGISVQSISLLGGASVATELTIWEPGIGPAGPSGAAGSVASAIAFGSGAGDYAGSTGAFTDIDAAALTLTVAAAAGDVLDLTFLGALAVTANSGLTFTVGGTNVATEDEGVLFVNQNGACTMRTLHTVVSGEVSAGSTIVRVQYKGSVSVYNRTTLSLPALLVLNYGH